MPHRFRILVNSISRKVVAPQMLVTGTKFSFMRSLYIKLVIFDTTL